MTANDDHRDDSADDLTVARRAHRRAQERIAKLQQQMLVARKALMRAHRALGETRRKPGHRLAKSLSHARSELERGLGHARIDQQVVYTGTARPGSLHYLGKWRPPTPPESPQVLDCSAAVCRCLEYLRSPGEVRQHWETDCFDVPDCEPLESIGLYYLVKEFDADQQEGQQ